jgi:hypothetical protein
MALRKNNFYLIILFLALVLVFFKVYSFHFGYNYPLHIDEYHHIAQSVQIIEERGFVSTNPYFKEPIIHNNLEPGFHIILSEIFLMTGIDPVRYYGFLPAFFALLSSLMLFVLVKKITKNFWAGIFSVLFFISLKSSVNILGIKFFTPLTACIPLIYLFILVLIEAMTKSDTKKLLLCFIFSSALIIIYPLFGTLILPMALLYVLLNFDALKGFYFKAKDSFDIEKMANNKIAYIKFILLIIGIISIVLLSFYYFTRYIGFHINFRWIIESLIFEEGWGKVEIKYFLPYLYGIVPTILAMIGIFHCLKTKKHLIFVLSSFITIGLVAFFHKFKFSILSPYQRTLYFSMVFLVPLSALGLTYAINYFMETDFSVISRKSKGPLILSFVIIVFIATFSSEYNLVDEREKYQNNIIDDYDYESIKWIQDNYGKGNIVIAPLFVSSTVYPISKNYVVSILPGQLTGESINASVDFFRFGCEEKKKIANQTKADIVLSKTRIECDFLNEVYNKRNFVYKVNI